MLFTNSEKRYGSFSRTVSLPQNVTRDEVDAHHDNGDLTVAIPKVGKLENKKIEI